MDKLLSQLAGVMSTATEDEMLEILLAVTGKSADEIMYAVDLLLETVVAHMHGTDHELERIQGVAKRMQQIK